MRASGLALFVGVLAALLSPGMPAGDEPPGPAPVRAAEDLLIVDCLLPGQVRQLGRRTTYLSARRPARLPARDCEIRGGEYVAYDRADARSALAAWLPAAEAGDTEAQRVVGEIHERGIGLAPDPAAAVAWYERAARSGDRRAQVNLGHLYESGRGVARDLAVARRWYAKAAGRDAEIDFDPAPPPGPDPAQLERLRQSLAARDAQVAQLEAEVATARAANDVALATREAALAEARADLQRLGRDLAAVTAVAEERAARLAALEAAAAQRQLAPPQVTLIEPPVRSTRGIVVVAPGASRQLVGQVVAPAGLEVLTVNGAATGVNEAGVFSTALPPAATRTTVSVVAVDRQGRRAEEAFVLDPVAPAAAPAAARDPAAAIDFGRYHALVIGNEDYAQIGDLASPVADATEIAALLERRYGFRVTLLLNATRYQMLTALNDLRERLTTEDNLLIYYAGHGELEDVNQRGYWLPVDAERESTANWIPTTAITDMLNIMRAKQVMLVVDSCYAAALTRSSIGRLPTATTAAERKFWMRQMAGKRARTVLTSGGLAPVMDAGGGRHSVFARALLEVLAANDEVLEGQRLHREVAARVAYAAAGLDFDQVPEYAPVRFAGHEAGEFFLVPGGL